MKTLFAAALVLALPCVALAQTAPRASAQPVSEARSLNGGVSAGTLPNTFDAPAAPPAARPAPPAAAAAQSEPSAPEVVEAAETALKATIAAAQNGTLNYDDMTPDLATKVRAQAVTMTPIIQGFGRLTTVEHRGRENGAELFLVTFENQVTQWIIGLNGDDKIAALLFRPAPDATPAA